MKRNTLLRTVLALALALGAMLLSAPAPSEAGPCPRIGCPSGFCKQDSDCTAVPGGTCDKFCASMGCCVY